jgi:hypothetical protein
MYLNITMKHFYKLLFITVFLSPLFSSAQSNYKPGYIITLNGDTVKGYVNYKEWDKNPSTVMFKVNNNSSDKKQYSLDNILAFGVNSYENYVRYIGFVSQDRPDLSSGGNGIDTSKLLDTIFLRVVNKGDNVVLFTYKDVKKVRYFISTSQSPPIELEYHVYVEYSDDGDKNIITQHGYRAKLINIASKYQPNNNGLIAEIQQANYTEADLYKVAAKINGLTTPQNQLISRSEMVFFAGAAINNTVTSFSNGIGLHGAKNSSLSPKINIGEDFLINKNVGTIVFRMELSFTTNSVNTSNSTATNSNYTDNESIKFKQSILTVNPQLLYNFYTVANLKIYVSGGVTLNFNSYTNQQYSVIYSYPGLQSAQPVGLPGFTAANFSITGKMGCILNKKLNIYAGYNPHTKINNDFTYAVYITPYYAGINYLFGKN